MAHGHTAPWNYTVPAAELYLAALDRLERERMRNTALAVRAAMSDAKDFTTFIRKLDRPC